MKNSPMKSLLFTFCLLFSASFLQASPIEGPSSTSTIRKAITKMIMSPELKKNGINQELVNITFRITSSKQIEIVNINTESPYLANYVKEQLQGKKLNVSDEVDPAFKYTLKITYKTES